MCEGLSGSTRSAATLYQRASLRISPDKSRYRTSPVLELQMSGKGVISNDADHFKRFYSCFLWARTHLSHGTRIASLWLSCFTCVTPTSSGRFRFIDSVLPTKHLFGHDRPG